MLFAFSPLCYYPDETIHFYNPRDGLMVAADSNAHTHAENPQKNFPLSSLGQVRIQPPLRFVQLHFSSVLFDVYRGQKIGRMVVI